MAASGEQATAGATIRPPGRHYMLAMLVLIYAINFIDRTILNVLVQPIKTDLHLSDAQIGLISGAAFGIFYGVMGLPFARIAERRSRRNLISISLAFWSVATVLCGAAANFWHLFAARIGLGVGEAGCTPAAQSMISDVYPAARRSTALSIYSLGVPIGTLFGALCGGWIGQQFGWRMAFVVVGVPGVVIALIARLTMREPLREGVTNGAEIPSLAESLSRLWSQSAFRHLAIAFAFAATGGYSLGLFFVAFLQRMHGVRLLDASFAYGLVSGLAGIVGMVAGGLLTDYGMRKDRRMQCWVPAFAHLLAAPLFIIGLLQDDVLMLALFVIPAAALYPMYVGPAFAAAHGMVEPRMRATASAALLLGSTVVGMGLGPFLTGLVSDIAARSYFEGDFDLACGGPAAVLTACGTAQAQGLLAAMCVAAACYFGSAVHFAIAGARTGRER